MTAVPDRPWPDPDLPPEHRVELLLRAMTLTEKVGQLHQSANLDPDRDGDLIRGGRVGSSLLANGATAGNERDTGVSRPQVDACRRLALRSRASASP